MSWLHFKFKLESLKTDLPLIESGSYIEHNIASDIRLWPLVIW